MKIDFIEEQIVADISVHGSTPSSFLPSLRGRNQTVSAFVVKEAAAYGMLRYSIAGPIPGLLRQNYHKTL